MAVSRRTKLQGTGAVLLLAGLALTHTLHMLWHLVTVVGSWAAGFVFSPLVWLGVILGVAGLGLLVAGRWVGRVERRVEQSLAPARKKRRGASSLPKKSTPATDDDPEIAAILKKYGIS